MYLYKKSVFLFFLLIFSFLLISNGVFAKKIFDDYVVNNQEIKIENYTFRALSDEDLLILNDVNSTKRIILPIDDSVVFDTFLFQNEDSKTIFDDDLKKYNLSGIRTNQDDIHLNKLLVTKITNALEISRSLKPKEPDFFSKLNVITKIKNVGNEDLVGIKFIDEIPIFLKLNNYTDVNLDRQLSNIAQNKINHKFNLKVDEEKTLIANYNIIGYSTNNLTLPSSKLIYNAFDSDVELLSSEENLVLKYPLDISIKENINKVNYKKKFNLTLVLENKHLNNKIDLENFQIVLPKGLNLITNNDNIIKISENIYQIEGVIDKQEKKEIKLLFIPNLIGLESIKFMASYKFRNIDFNDELIQEFKVQFNDLTFDFDLKNPKTSIIRGGDLVNLDFSIENNEDVVIENLSVEIFSDLFNKINYKFLKLNSKTSVNNKINKEIPIFIPSLDNDEFFNVTFKLSFDIGSNEFKVYEKTKSYEILKGLSDEMFNVQLNFINTSNDLVFVNLTLIKLNNDLFDDLSIFINSTNKNEKINLNENQKTNLFNPSMKEFFIYSFKKNNLSNIEPISIFLNISKNNEEIKKEFKFYLDLLSFNILDNKDEIILSQELLSNITNTTNTSVNETSIDASENSSSTNRSKDIFKDGQEIEDKKKFEPKIKLFHFILFAIIISFIIVGVSLIKLFKKENREEATNKKKKFSFNFKNLFSKKKKGKKYEDPIDLGLYNQENVSSTKRVSLIPAPGSGIEKLENYINVNKNFGKSNDEIRKNLKSEGWLDEVIDVFLK
ncbi:MAG: hypothetical protein ACLFPJ_05535 [Candidatus Woesearchaeota archaeon]